MLGLRLGCVKNHRYLWNSNYVRLEIDDVCTVVFVPGIRGPRCCKHDTNCGEFPPLGHPFLMQDKMNIFDLLLIHTCTSTHKHVF